MRVPDQLTTERQDGAWWYVVVTFTEDPDGGAGVQTLYVNGQQMSSLAAPAPLTGNSAHFRWGERFAGTLDELAVYDFPLSKAAIQRHYQWGLGF